MTRLCLAAAAACVLLTACGEGGGKDYAAETPPEGYGAPPAGDTMYNTAEADANHETMIAQIRGDAPQQATMQGQAQGVASDDAAMKKYAPLPAGAIAMQKVQIPDPKGFGQPMVAASVLIPAGWRTQGGIVWGPYQQCGPDYANNWSAMSPDGASSLRVMPVPNWSGTNSIYPTNQQQQQQSACEQAFYSSAREYLSSAAQRFFPQGRIVDYRPLTEEVKPIQDMLAQFPDYSAQGMQSRMFADGGEVLVSYQDSGRDMRAVISAVAMIMQVKLSDFANPNQTVMETVTGYPSSVAIVTAPNGQIDFNLRKRTQSSMRFTPEWSREIAKYQAEKARNQTKASAARHQATMDAMREASNIRNGIYQESQIASDRNQREVIESIRGVETYNDPVYGGAVELDNTYDHAWRVKNDDTYIMTNDPNFNPNAYDIDAQELKRLP